MMRLLLHVYLVAFVPCIHSEQLSNSVKKSPQGILEIPKQAATVIRNFIDSRLQTYLHLTTPKSTNPDVPQELGQSILGHLLLGNLFATPRPAVAYNPTAIEAVTSGPLPIFVETTNSTSPPPPPQPETPRVQVQPTLPPAPTPPPPSPSTTRTIVHHKTNKPILSYSRPANSVPVVLGSEEDDERTTEYILVNYGGPSKRNRTVGTKSPQTFEIEPQVVETYWIDDNAKPTVVLPVGRSTEPPTTTEDEDEETDVDEAEA